VARSGIARVDQLLDGTTSSPIGTGDPDRGAVSLVQDFLISHGADPGLAFQAGVRGSNRGVFGPLTRQSVQNFQTKHSLPVSGSVDRTTLQTLIATSPTDPRATQGHLTLVLDTMFTGLARVMCRTTQFEGGGKFAALNLNTDRAGLSFGIIQWAQKPGRLHEILGAFHTQEPQKYVDIVCGGSAHLAQGLLDHTAKSGGGVDSHGKTVDAAFDLTAEP
jgi:hypothetical protein